MAERVARYKMQPVRGWKPAEKPPLNGFDEFDKALRLASVHNAAETTNEAVQARKATDDAAQIVVANGWPYWATERAFRYVSPLMSWDAFNQRLWAILANAD